MLSFGLKIAWFLLSLSGLLSSWVVLPATIKAMRVLWVPVIYSLANTVLQGLFCIGMIWKMNPFAMPQAFRVAQTIVMAVAWLVIASIGLFVTATTAISVICPHGENCIPKTTSMGWRSTFLLILFCIGFSLAALAAQIAVLLRLDAVQPTDGMHCDATHPEWVRLLGYAGMPLLLAIPALLATCVTYFQLYRRSISPTNPSDSENLTPLPIRRINRTATPTFSVRHPTPSLRFSQSITSTSFTHVYSGLVDSPPSSITSGPIAQFISPLLPVHSAPPTERRTRLRYNLPFFVEAPTPRVSLERERPRRTPSVSPIFFAPAPSPPSGDNEDGEKEYADTDSAVSGSLRWARMSTSDSSIRKSELDFMRAYNRDEEHASGVAIENYVRTPTPHSAAPAPPEPRIRRLLVFQLLISVALILAAISTLIDVFTGRPQPMPFGTHHVSLLLLAWAPAVVFGPDGRWVSFPRPRRMYML